MEKVKKAKVVVLGLTDNKIDRVTTYEGVNSIVVGERQTILYSKTYTGELEIIGVVPNTHIIRSSWEEQ